MRLCPRSLALASSIPVLGLESVCPRKGCPWPWPRIFFVSLALALASSLVSSTPPLPIISFFLSELFNLCLSTGTYPDLMKVAEVIPIFKKGQKDKLTNYRPISLLSQFNKIFEKLLHSRIYSYPSKFNLFSERQFGFRKNNSTSLAICNIYDELLNNVDEGKYSCCIFLDLSKAFDSVQHDILLCKLEKLYGFRGNALELMKSYLTNRVQYTKIGNSKSKQLKIDCGVPQGSSLDPLLFMLYVNDLPQVSEFSTTLFADDT